MRDGHLGSSVLSSSVQPALSHGLLAAAVAAAGEAIICTRPDGRVLYLNPAAEKLTQWTLAAAQGQHIDEFFTLKVDDAGALRSLTTLYGHDTQIFRGQNLRRSRDGVELLSTLHCTPVPGDDGAPQSVVLICRDINEPAHSAQQFSYMVQELHSLKIALDEHAIVAITDVTGRITYVNDKFCLISGYERAELIGQDHRLINSGHHPKEFFKDLWSTICAGKIWRGEIKNRAKDGSYYWVYTTIVPFARPDGTLYQFVTVRTDISTLR